MTTERKNGAIVADAQLVLAMAKDGDSLALLTPS